jgi:hypothetical protein
LAQRICFKTFLIFLLFEAWEQMLKFTSFKRQELILYLNSGYFYFPKIWSITRLPNMERRRPWVDEAHGYGGAGRPITGSSAGHPNGEWS